MLIGVICRYDYPYKRLLDHVFMPHGWCGLRPPIKLRQHLAFQGRIAKLWAALWKSLVDENLVLLISFMWVKYSKAKINHPPVITINRWYKPFPNGWFMTLFYPNYVQSLKKTYGDPKWFGGFQKWWYTQIIQIRTVWHSLALKPMVTWGSFILILHDFTNPEKYKFREIQEKHIQMGIVWLLYVFFLMVKLEVVHILICHVCQLERMITSRD